MSQTTESINDTILFLDNYNALNYEYLISKQQPDFRNILSDSKNCTFINNIYDLINNFAKILLIKMHLFFKNLFNETILIKKCFNLLFAKKQIYVDLLAIIILLIILNIICNEYTKYKFSKYIENMKKQAAETEAKSQAFLRKTPNLVDLSTTAMPLQENSTINIQIEDNDYPEINTDDDECDDADDDNDSDYVEEEDDTDSDYEEYDEHKKSVLILEYYKNNTTKIINLIKQEDTKNFKPTYLKINGVEHNVLRGLNNVLIVILETYSSNNIYEKLKYIKYKNSHYTKDGYTYYNNLKISLSPANSCTIIKEIIYLSNLFEINIVLNLEKWDDSLKNNKQWLIINN